MVTRWGMSERVGLVELAPRENPYLSSANGFAGATIQGVPATYSIAIQQNLVR